MVATAKETVIPIGMMVSRGQVKYEAKENLWKSVETCYFPLLQGMKIKTEKGAAIIAFGDRSQIEVGENSLFSFDQNNRFNLLKGNVLFRIQSNIEMKLNVGNLSITKPLPRQASKGSSVIPAKDEDMIGLISVHSNGSVTVKSVQGSINIIGGEQTLLASLSPKASLTIPSKVVAQAGGTPGDIEDAGKLLVHQATEIGETKFLGLSLGTSAGAAAGAAAAGVGTYWVLENDQDRTPKCIRKPTY